jgi:hypothetical protein
MKITMILIVACLVALIAVTFAREREVQRCVDEAIAKSQTAAEELRLISHCPNIDQDTIIRALVKAALEEY